MDNPSDDKKSTVIRTVRILARIAGSSVGFLVGVYVAYIAVFLVAQLFPSLREGNPDAAGLFIALFIAMPVSLLIGGSLGAAAGANIMQKIFRQRTSFWKALLGTVAGLLVGGLPTALCLWASYDHGIWDDGLSAFLVAVAVACASAASGAVIGSGWKAKTTDAAGTGS
jgi:hypothetical protein